MLGWFKRRDAARFSPRQRLIYRYFDGKREVWADPVALFKRVAAAGPELLIDLKVSQSASKDAEAAYVNALAKVREIFHLPPPVSDAEVGEAALSSVEVVELFNHFMAYCGDVKKNSATTATPPTETTPPSPPCAAGPTPPT